MTRFLRIAQAFVTVLVSTLVVVGVAYAGIMNPSSGGGSATPPGADTQVIFNNAGAYGADANLTWTGSILGVNGELNLDGGSSVNLQGADGGSIYWKSADFGSNRLVLHNVNATSTLTVSTAGAESNFDFSGVTLDRTFTVPDESGALVLDTATQTLTNKTLTTPTIGSFTNAGHNHTNAAGGGQLTDAALSSAVTVAKGGTGTTTLTANNLILGNGTSAPLFVAPGTSGNVLTSNGTTWQSTAPAGASVKVCTFTTDVTVSSTDVETTLMTCTIPANTLGTTGALVGRIYFTAAQQSSGGGYIRLKYGATEMASDNTTWFSSAANNEGHMDFSISAVGATNSQEAFLEVSSSADGTATNWNHVSAFGTAAEDSTASKTLAVTIQFLTAGTTQKITAKSGYVMKLQ